MVRELSRSRFARLEELKRAGKVAYHPRTGPRKTGSIKTFKLSNGMKLERVVKGTH